MLHKCFKGRKDSRTYNWIERSLIFTITTSLSHVFSFSPRTVMEYILIYKLHNHNLEVCKYNNTFPPLPLQVGWWDDICTEFFIGIPRMSLLYIWNIMLDRSGSKPVYCFETKYLYQIAAAIAFIFTKLHAHYTLLQTEVLCLPFGKSKVSHTAVNSSVS